MFFSFEGSEGSGKTTQVKAVSEKLKALGHNILVIREPGTTDIGNQIRNILVENFDNKKMFSETEVLLFCAARAQLVREILVPALKDPSVIILCDRYIDSTLAYQGYGHGMDIKKLMQIIDFAIDYKHPEFSTSVPYYPNKTFFLDIKPVIALSRRYTDKNNGGDFNRFDAMEMDFHERVYRGYKEIAQGYGHLRFVHIGANKPQEEITDKIVSNILYYCGL